MHMFTVTPLVVSSPRCQTMSLQQKFHVVPDHRFLANALCASPCTQHPKTEQKQSSQSLCMVQQHQECSRQRQKTWAELLAYHKESSRQRCTWPLMRRRWTAAMTAEQQHQVGQQIDQSSIAGHATRRHARNASLTLRLHDQCDRWQCTHLWPQEDARPAVCDEQVVRDVLLLQHEACIAHDGRQLLYAVAHMLQVNQTQEQTLSASRLVEGAQPCVQANLNSCAHAHRCVAVCTILHTV